MIRTEKAAVGVLIGIVAILQCSCMHLTSAGKKCGGCGASASIQAPVEGFKTEIEDGRLWVLRNDGKKSEKHITLIGAGPAGMTVKSSDKKTAVEYLAAKPGYTVEFEDGRIWVLKAGEKKHEKHITMVGAGFKGSTLKALDKKTAIEYLAAKPGYTVEYVDGRIWVLKAGEKKHEKHITMVGAGPNKTTVKALSKKTAVEYLAAKRGFKVEVGDDGRIWIFGPGEKAEKKEKHVTRVGAGPNGATIKALSRSVLDAYTIAVL